MRTIVFSETRLVKRQRGSLPILLTAPHGGDQDPDNVQERDPAQTPDHCLFNTARDNHTAQITETVAQKVLELTGQTPYIVIARFRRRFIDANRDNDCAFTDQQALPFYNEYHKRISGYASEINAQNRGQGFLFDIHGTGVINSDPADVYIGTADGAALRKDFARGSLFLQHGLHGLLKSVRRQVILPPQTTPQNLQYRVSPADGTTPETSQVNGGYTIRKYAAVLSGIQIEIANTLRDEPVKREVFCEDLAQAMVNFTRRHAPF